MRAKAALVFWVASTLALRSEPGAASETQSVIVALGAYPDLTEARQGWLRLAESYGDLFARWLPPAADLRRYVINERLVRPRLTADQKPALFFEFDRSCELGARGCVRVVVGPLSVGGAAEICSQLAGREQECMTSHYASSTASAPAWTTPPPAPAPQTRTDGELGGNLRGASSVDDRLSNAGRGFDPGNGAPERVVFDPGAAPRTRIRLGRYLRFGARVELGSELERDLDLTADSPDGTSAVAPELLLALSFEPTASVRAFVNAEISRTFDVNRHGRDRTRRGRFRLGRAYVSFAPSRHAFALRVGRQRIRDPREWLYDDQLDAVRTFFQVSGVVFDLSLSRKGLFDGDLLREQSDERINNYLASASVGPKNLRSVAYAFLRDDRTVRDERLLFLGIQSRGEIMDDFDYWLELAHLRGGDRGVPIRSLGFDLGAAYRVEAALRPSVALGLGFGSGDGDPDDGVDTRFRQTGLQDNKDRFFGVTRFKYYGELTDPELSNLVIVYGGVGIRPTRRSSVDVIYHVYRQHQLSTRFRDAELDVRPDGRSLDLGSELDIVVGYEEIRNLDFKLVFGLFRAGRAFPTGADRSLLLNFDVRYSF